MGTKTLTRLHSGLAVQPNNDEKERDSLFHMAHNASAEESSQIRRTITMVRFARVLA